MESKILYNASDLHIPVPCTVKDLGPVVIN